MEYFRRSQTCHTLKDLEANLPTAANVNKMQVKDMIKELTDESKVKVEKIGSGNWYWCWAGEELREKQDTLAQLEYGNTPKSGLMLTHWHRAEKSKLEASNALQEQQIKELKCRRATADDNAEHQELLERVRILETEVNALTIEEQARQTAILGRVEQIMAETDTLKQQAVRDTDNIYAVEFHFLANIMGGDRQKMELLRRECYGAYYVEDEGLPDIDAL